MKRILTAVLLAPIRLYQRWISPAMAPRCRYYPTCSSYASQAIRELAVWRLLRCNPFSPGGVDEVADRRLFAGTPTSSHAHEHPAHEPTVPTGADLT